MNSGATCLLDFSKLLIFVQSRVKEKVYSKSVLFAGCLVYPNFYYFIYTLIPNPPKLIIINPTLKRTFKKPFFLLTLQNKLAYKYIRQVKVLKYFH